MYIIQLYSSIYSTMNTGAYNYTNCNYYIHTARYHVITYKHTIMHACTLYTAQIYTVQCAYVLDIT